MKINLESMRELLEVARTNKAQTPKNHALNGMKELIEYAVYLENLLVAERERQKTEPEWPVQLQRQFRLDDLRGHEHAKRVAEIALAGRHTVTFVTVGNSHQDMVAIARWINKHEPDLAKVVKPCPCGNYGSPERVCMCSMALITRHRNRYAYQQALQADIVLDVYWQPDADEKRQGEPDESVLVRVSEAQEAPDPSTEMDGSCKAIMKSAHEKFCMSEVQVQKTLEIARTIAKLAGKDTLNPAYLAEALHYQGKMNNQ